MNDVAPKDPRYCDGVQNYALPTYMTVLITWLLAKLEIWKAEIKERELKTAEILGWKDTCKMHPLDFQADGISRIALGKGDRSLMRVFLDGWAIINLDLKLRVAMRAEIAKISSSVKTTATIYVWPNRSNDNGEIASWSWRRIHPADWHTAGSAVTKNKFVYQAALSAGPQRWISSQLPYPMAILPTEKDCACDDLEEKDANWKRAMKGKMWYGIRQKTFTLSQSLLMQHQIPQWRQMLTFQNYLGAETMLYTAGETEFISKG